MNPKRLTLKIECFGTGVPTRKLRSLSGFLVGERGKTEAVYIEVDQSFGYPPVIQRPENADDSLLLSAFARLCTRPTPVGEWMIHLPPDDPDCVALSRRGFLTWMNGEGAWAFTDLGKAWLTTIKTNG